jgi:hypothetical protein
MIRIIEPRSSILDKELTEDREVTGGASMERKRPHDPKTRQELPEPRTMAATAAPDRASKLVWCEARGCEAVVSTVRRDLGAKVLHYVQWCSLTGIDVACDERCIFSVGAQGEPLSSAGRSRRE